MQLYKIAFRNIKRNLRRSILSGVAIGVSVYAIVMMFAFTEGMMNDFQGNITDYVTGDIRVKHESFDENAGMNSLRYTVNELDRVVAAVEANDSVAYNAPRIQFGTAIYGTPRVSMLDVKDFGKLGAFIKEGKHPVAAFILKQFSARNISLPGDQSTEEEKIIFLDNLYNLMRRYNLADFIELSSAKLSEATVTLAADNRNPYNKVRLNRMILEDLLPDYINKTNRMDKNFMGLMGIGVDFTKENNFIDFRDKIVKGSLPANGGRNSEIVLSSGLAGEMGITVGDKITIYTKTKEDSMNGATYRVKGIAAFPVGSFNSKLFFLPLDSAQKLIKLHNSSTEILVKLKPPANVEQSEALLNTQFKEAGLKSTEAVSWKKIGMYFSLFSMMDVMYAFIAMFFLVLGTTVIIVTTIMVILERMREIGTVAAMGMKGKDIVRLFFLEAFFISLIAAAIGVVLGVITVIPLSIIGLDFGSAMEGIDFEISSMVYPEISWKSTILVFIYAVIMSSITAILPARKAAKVEPVEALRTI